MLTWVQRCRRWGATTAPSHFDASTKISHEFVLPLQAASEGPILLGLGFLLLVTIAAAVWWLPRSGKTEQPEPKEDTRNANAAPRALPAAEFEKPLTALPRGPDDPLPDTSQRALLPAFDQSASGPRHQRRIRPPEQVMTDLLSAYEGAMPQRELVNRTNLSPSRVSQLLSDLEEQGIIHKQRIGAKNFVSLIPESERSEEDTSDDVSVPRRPSDRRS